MNVFRQSTSTMFVSIVNTIEQSSIERSHPSHIWVNWKTEDKYRSRYSRMDQVTVFHKFDLVHSWIPWAIYSPQQHQSISQKENFYRVFFHLKNLSPIYHLSWTLSPLVKLITVCRYFWLTVLLSTPKVSYSKHSFLRLIFKNFSV